MSGASEHSDAEAVSEVETPDKQVTFQKSNQANTLVQTEEGIELDGKEEEEHEGQYDSQCEDDPEPEKFKQKSSMEQEKAFTIGDDAMLELDITEAELEDLKKEFEFFDRDRNGTVAVADCGTIVRSQGFNPSEKELKDLTNQFDSQGTGTLDFREVLTMVAQQKHQRNEEEEEDIGKDLLDCFKVFDHENNGFISASELRYIMSHIGERLSEEELDEMLRSANMDSDERIDYEEFVVTLTSK